MLEYNEEILSNHYQPVSGCVQHLQLCTYILPDHFSLMSENPDFLSHNHFILQLKFFHHKTEIVNHTILLFSFLQLSLYIKIVTFLLRIDLYLAILKKKIKTVRKKSCNYHFFIFSPLPETSFHGHQISL